MKPRHHPKTLINLKSLPRSKREIVRRQLFSLYEKGIKPHAAAMSLRLNPSCVHALFARFRAEGEQAVKERKRGPASSPKAILTKSQKDELARAISQSSPRQLVFGFALWSSKAVVAYVRKKFHKTLCRRTARRYLRELGFTYQCPVRRAREQNPAAIQTWLQETYPAIKAEASRKGARIYWADESTVMASTTKARGYSPRGTAPVLEAPANRSVRCSYIAAVDNKGELFFQTFDGAMDAARFKAFILALLEDAGVPVSLIVDNLKVHHATCLKTWFSEMEREKNFRIHYLPSYAPEYNPEEYLNRNIKAAAAEQALPASQQAAVLQTTATLQRHRDDRESVRRLFKNEKVRYAAE